MEKRESAPRFCKSKRGQESSSSEDEDEDYNKAGLIAHNYYRLRHGAPLLKTNAELASYAQEWADKLTREDKFEHRQDIKYGENLLALPSSKERPKAHDVVGAWYSEIKYYKYGREMPSLMKTGHFTQVVWKSTSKVGMAISRGKKDWIIVANYDPPGNYKGKYTANVLPPQ